MNILITGIHGFVGSNLVFALKKQNTIYGLDIVSPQKDGVVKTYGWNELEQIHAIDCIIHLAGKAHDNKSQTNAQAYFEINTGLTQQIFDWFLSSGAQEFIYFSSVKAAADSVRDTILTEDVTPAPRGPYGESKLAAEVYVRERLGEWEKERLGEEKIKRLGEGEIGRRGDRKTERRGDEENGGKGEGKKNVYILRPCMIHGPGNKGNLNLLYNMVNKGIPYPLGAFENKRSFTSIDNLSFVINQLIEKEIPGGTYNMADDQSISTNELIALIADILKKPNRTWHWNKPVVQSFARLGSLLHLPLNTARLQKLTESYLVSNNKIKQALGITQMPISAKEGLRKTLESFGRIKEETKNG